jgi:hypothetical protein
VLRHDFREAQVRNAGPRPVHRTGALDLRSGACYPELVKSKGLNARTQRESVPFCARSMRASAPLAACARFAAGRKVAGRSVKKIDRSSYMRPPLPVTSSLPV